QIYQKLVPEFERRHHVSVNLALVNGRAISVRLGQMFMSDDATAARDLPDVVEVEIAQVGRFFRPPLRNVGFLPLDDYLKRSGWQSKIVASRFAPWSKEGVIFGVPHDVHPCTITYRQDLFWGVERADGTLDG